MELNDFPWVTGTSHETGSNREFQPENPNTPEWDGRYEKRITLTQYLNAGQSRESDIARYADNWDAMDQTPVYDAWAWCHVSRETDNGLNPDKSDNTNKADEALMLDDIRKLLNPVGWK